AVPDLDAPVGGPLAGLAGAIAWCATAGPPELILTIAVDTPFVPADYAARMRAALGAKDRVVVAAYGGQPYPTNALWRVSALDDLPARMRNGTTARSLFALADALGARHLDWPDEGGGDPFANLNTPDDLAA